MIGRPVIDNILRIDVGTRVVLTFLPFRHGFQIAWTESTVVRVERGKTRHKARRFLAGLALYTEISCSSSFFLDTALLPAYVAAISFVVLLLHSITGPKTPTIISSRPIVVSAPAHGTAKSHWQSYVTNAGGLSIVVHKFLRMDSMFALLGLLTYSAIRDGMTLLRVIYLLIAVRLLPQLCRCSLNTHLRSTPVYFLAGMYWHQLRRRV